MLLCDKAWRAVEPDLYPNCFKVYQQTTKMSRKQQIKIKLFQHCIQLIEVLCDVFVVDVLYSNERFALC